MSTRLALLAVFLAATARAGGPDDVGLRPAERAKLRELARDPAAGAILAPLRRAADLALTEEPRPIERIATEHKLDADPVKQATQAALADMGKMEALGWVWVVDGDRRYLDALARYLGAWAATNRPCGDPIDETNLERAIVAFALARDQLPAPIHDAVARWLRGVADAEIAGRQKPGDARRTNNFHSHRLKIVGLIGHALGDARLEQWALDGFQEQVGVNLLPSGESFDFRERDALHYHTYDIQPLLRLAIVLARDGHDLYAWRAPSGASLAAAVAFLLPYARGERSHAEFVHTKVAFDRARAAAAQAQYQPGRAWDRKEARAALAMAAYFQSDLAPLVAELAEAKGSPYPNLQLLLDAAMLSASSRPSPR
jgi:hypothetical protein